MADQNTNAEASLQKLGQRVRAGYAKQHPAQHLDLVRAAVRQQYDQEQQIKSAQPLPPPSKPKTKGRGFEPED